MNIKIKSKPESSSFPSYRLLISVGPMSIMQLLRPKSCSHPWLLPLIVHMQPVGPAFIIHLAASPNLTATSKWLSLSSFPRFTARTQLFSLPPSWPDSSHRQPVKTRSQICPGLPPGPPLTQSKSQSPPGPACQPSPMSLDWSPTALPGSCCSSLTNLLKNS